MTLSGNDPLAFDVRTARSAASSPAWPDAVRVRFSDRSGWITRAGVRIGEIDSDTPLYFTIEAAGAAHRMAALALGYSVWGEDDYITPEVGWHIHDPCRHGLYQLERGIQPPAPDEGFDGDIEGAIACLEARARLIAGIVTAEAGAFVPSTSDAAPAAGSGAEPQDLESLLGDLPSSDSAQEATAEWRRGSAVQDVLDRAADAGWDVAVCEWEPRVVVLHAPDVSGPSGNVPTGLGQTGPAGPLSGTYYYLRQRPAAGDTERTADLIRFEHRQSCPGGAHTARVLGDIAEWHWTTPIVSAPSEGWMSVIGDGLVFVHWIRDTHSAWTGCRVLPDGRWQTPPAERDWLLTARSMFG